MTRVCYDDRYKKYWLGFKGCPLQEHQQESFLVDVHGCGHIMRILRGLNEKGKCIFYGHQMCIKNGRKGLEFGRKWYVWTKCPDVMRGGQGKKFTFGQNVQTRNGKNMV